MAAREQVRPIIIRRQDGDADHGHHGGAWKVAYADFMTAMMAFFLLMWIVSSATKDQLNGISEYFTPAKVSMTAKGGLGALGGTTFGPKGVLSQSNGVSSPKGLQTKSPNPEQAETHPLPQMTDKQAPAAAATMTKTDVIVASEAQSAGKGSAPDGTKSGDAARTVVERVDSHAADDAHFKEVETELTEAMKSDADLKPLLKNVMFEKTKDGLNIQIVDQDKRPMFTSGSAKVDGATLALMERLGKAIAGLPNKIRIAGHTDAVPYAEGASHDNWELSSERANATRRVFLSAGVPHGRIERISGLADTDPLIPENPRDPRNRRITVTLAYQQTDAGAGQGGAQSMGPSAPAKAEQTGEAQSGTAQPGGAPGTGGADAAKAPEKSAMNGPAAEPAAASALAQTYSLVSLNDLSRASK